MNKQVLFIQGAGEGAYQVDRELVMSLRDALGTEYRILYPEMPEADDEGYEAWKARISKELDALEGEIILVGHSVGGAILLKYLSEEKVRQPIAGLFLVAAPYFGAPNWQVDEVTLRKGFASQLPQSAPIFLYHSRDDDVVPFAHLALYRKKLPQATLREFDQGGHQFNNDLSQVAADIEEMMDDALLNQDSFCDGATARGSSAAA